MQRLIIMPFKHLKYIILNDSVMWVWILIDMAELADIWWCLAYKFPQISALTSHFRHNGNTAVRRKGDPPASSLFAHRILQWKKILHLSPYFKGFLVMWREIYLILLFLCILECHILTQGCLFNRMRYLKSIQFSKKAAVGSFRGRASSPTAAHKHLIADMFPDNMISLNTFFLGYSLSYLS